MKIYICACVRVCGKAQAKREQTERTPVVVHSL